mmetsp:Transcript_17385/g.50091  ORF Transcript_17385/g.50091 Transcript_17385/m.50091 type:complete len:269 (-) Transcript_17385:31-837(-)
MVRAGAGVEARSPLVLGGLVLGGCALGGARVAIGVARHRGAGRGLALAGGVRLGSRQRRMPTRRQASLRCPRWNHLVVKRQFHVGTSRWLRRGAATLAPRRRRATRGRALPCEPTPGRSLPPESPEPQARLLQEPVRDVRMQGLHRRRHIAWGRAHRGPAHGRVLPRQARLAGASPHAARRLGPWLRSPGLQRRRGPTTPARHLRDDGLAQRLQQHRPHLGEGGLHCLPRSLPRRRCGHRGGQLPSALHAARGRRRRRSATERRVSRC